MKTYFECLPCVIRQALEAARHVTDDESVHEEVLRRATRALSELDFLDSSPVAIGNIHKIVREVTKTDDPYRSAKSSCNSNALKLYPEIRDIIRQSPNPLQTAIRLAVAGNIIDFIVDPDADRQNIMSTVEHALAAPFFPPALDQFQDAVNNSQRILYLGDNAGEIVFDRLLIEQFPGKDIAFVVRGGPVVNDVTTHDAQSTGMTELVEVIDNGSNLPGTVLGYCSEVFRRRFEEADLIVSKGQGNYESLSDVDQQIFFLFRAKCQVVAAHLGCEPGSLALLVPSR